jgi:hypothetical protein
VSPMRALPCLTASIASARRGRSAALARKGAQRKRRRAGRALDLEESALRRERHRVRVVLVAAPAQAE